MVLPNVVPLLLLVVVPLINVNRPNVTQQPKLVNTLRCVLTPPITFVPTPSVTPLVDSVMMLLLPLPPPLDADKLVATR